MATTMPTTDLPPAVNTYLRTPKDKVGSILGQMFTGDAVVHDEGRTHIGIDAIRTWNDSVAAAFTFTRTVVSAALRDNTAIVQAKLEGDFPGSPVELPHHFSVTDNKICALTICP
jgi:hypothetical protein